MFTTPIKGEGEHEGGTMKLSTTNIEHRHLSLECTLELGS